MPTPGADSSDILGFLRAQEIRDWPARRRTGDGEVEVDVVELLATVENLEKELAEAREAIAAAAFGRRVVVPGIDQNYNLYDLDSIYRADFGPDQGVPELHLFFRGGPAMPVQLRGPRAEALWALLSAGVDEIESEK